jgi:HD-GYP domain-containing protein (c-di-GMP phosphodiesterase class II)
MTTDRPYRLALSLPYTVTELRRCAGTQFDPEVVAALLEVLGVAGAEGTVAAGPAISGAGDSGFGIAGSAGPGDLIALGG